MALQPQWRSWSFVPSGIRGSERSRTSLRQRIKVEQSFFLNVIAEAPLAAHKYASFEDHGVSTNKPVLDDFIIC